MPLDTAIVQAFHQSGLTQEELSDRLGVRQPTVSDWLNGRRTPRARNLAHLKEVLGLAVPTSKDHEQPDQGSVSYIVFRINGKPFRRWRIIDEPIDTIFVDLDLSADLELDVKIES